MKLKLTDEVSMGHVLDKKTENETIKFQIRII